MRLGERVLPPAGGARRGGLARLALRPPSPRGCGCALLVRLLSRVVGAALPAAALGADRRHLGWDLAWPPVRRGGAFGHEASVVALVLVAAVTVLALLLVPRNDPQSERLSKTSRVAVDRFMVMKWMPGAPSASIR